MLPNQQSFQIPHFTTIQNNGPQPTVMGNGVALLIKNNIPFTKINPGTQLQVAAARIHTISLVTYCTIYLPPQGNVPIMELEQLIQSLPQPFIMFGDFNARHTSWNDNTSNRRGKQIFDFIQTNNLSLMHSSKVTHWHTATNTFSAIDFAICTPTLLMDTNCQVAEDLYHSDHYPIIFEHINYQPIVTKPKWKFKKAKWNNYRTEIKPRMPVEQHNTTTEAVTYFTTMIHTAAKNTIPQTKPQTTKYIVPWWTDEIGQLLNYKRRQQRIARQSKQINDIIIWKRAQANLRREIRKSQRNSFREYIESINERTPITSVWKRINKLRGKKTGTSSPILEINNNLISDQYEVANAFGTSLSNITNLDLNRTPGFLRRKRQQESQPLNIQDMPNQDYNQPFTINELKTALRKSGNTSAGPDDIHYEMLRQLPAEGQKYLLNIYNKLWHNGEYPDDWKIAQVIMFPKPGKDPKLPSNYRPISLTSCLSKIMEKMVNLRLQYYLEKEKLISPYQYGFRRNKNTTEALARMVSIIQNTINRGSQCIGIFFDLEKAYDTTWRRHILNEMSEMGIGGNMMKFAKNYLQNRSFQVRQGQQLSQEFIQHEGVPQGGVLSVTLFLIAINGLPQAVGETKNPNLFVDDFGILIVGNHLRSMCRQAQLAINKASEWTCNRGFKFNANKTTVVHFHRKNKTFAPIELTLQGELLTISTVIKFLGIYLDQRLNWMRHIQYLRETCTKALDILKCLSHIKWGSSRKILHRIYHTLIRSKLDYACQIYNTASDATLRKLEPIQNTAIRLITGAFKSSPIVSLQVESGEPPLSNRREMLSQQLYCKILTNPETETYKTVTDETLDGHNQRCTTLGQKVRTKLNESNIAIPITEQIQWPKYAPWLPPPTLCTALHTAPKATLTPIHQRTMYLEHKYTHNTELQFYTDGSKSQIVGYAAVSKTVVYAGALPTEATIFTAELTAIKKAYEHALENKKSITIFTDSLSAIQAMNDITTLHPLVVNIQDAARELQQQNIRSIICWIPSHTGIEMNEAADTAAKRAARLPIMHQKIPHRDYYHKMERCTKQQIKRN
ncbi:hypothetical protein SNEBB_007419 [Seison nebaliae]|nr:hypothetical protein SNEBB_007419 [Seison nebaliae]